MVAGAQHLGHLPAPELGRPGVLRVLEQPVGERLVARRRPRCPSRPGPAGRPPRSRPSPPPRRRPGRSRRSTARRRRGARGPARRRPRSARTAARTRRAPPARRRSAWSRRRPPGPSRQQRAGRVDRLDRVEDRLGHEHHPGAAAEGGVVDGAVGVGGAASRRSCTRTSSSAARRALPSRLCAGEVLDQVGEDREDVDAHVRRAHRSRSSPSGTSTVIDARRRARDHERQRHERRRPSSTSRSRAGLACDRVDRRRAPCRAVDDDRRRPARAPTARRGRRAARPAGRRRAGPRPPRGRRRPRSATIQRCWCGRDATTVSGPSSVVEHRTRGHALGPVGDEGDDDLAAEAVGLADPPDLEQVGGPLRVGHAAGVSRRTRRRPRRRRGRRRPGRRCGSTWPPGPACR